MCNLDNIDDEELVARYKAGEGDALDVLFTRMKSTVSSIARTYFLTGGTNEDLIQEGMIGLHKAILTYDEDKNVKFYMYATTCIRTAILDALRIANRDKHRALNDSVSLQDITHELDRETSPEGALLDEEKAKLLKEQIYSFLNTPQKKLLTYYLDGYTYLEIAKMMGKDIKYVDNTLQIIKRKIRKNMNI